MLGVAENVTKLSFPFSVIPAWHQLDIHLSVIVFKACYRLYDVQKVGEPPDSIPPIHSSTHTVEMVRHKS